MDRYRDFAPRVPFPSTWSDAIEDSLTNHRSSNFRIQLATSTSIRIAATATGPVIAFVRGKPRWIVSDLTTAHPGGVAGTYLIWIAAAVDVFTADELGEVDSTNHSFALRITATGATPSGTGSEALFNQIGTLEWDGSSILSIAPFENYAHPKDPHATQHNPSGSDPLQPEAVAGAGAMLMPPGVSMDWNGLNDPPGGYWFIEDGRTLNRVDYPALFANMGGTSSPHGLPTSTTFSLPDSRGRVSVGAGASGSGVFPTITNVLGAKFGRENVALTASQLAAHTHPLSQTAHAHWTTAQNPGGTILRIYNQGDAPYYAVPSGAQPFGSVGLAGQDAITSTESISITVGNNTGSGAVHENRQPSIVKNKIIKVK